MKQPLAIVPTYIRATGDIDLLETTLRTLRETASDSCDILVVDDGSPARDLLVQVFGICDRYDAELIDKKRNEGFSKTINVGLRRCMVEERDAVLVNADMEFGLAKDWLALMQRQKRSDGSGLASVVGALLLYPSGLIQHAGVGFSFLSRDFFHLHQFGPGNLPEAQQARVCPVTGALQFIRHECLAEIGLYDETFKLAFEDVDFCVRTLLSGRECVYQPGVRAVHHESAFRGQGRADDKIAKWTQESWMRFAAKYRDQNFAAFCPSFMDG